MQHNRNLQWPSPTKKLPWMLASGLAAANRETCLRGSCGVKVFNTCGFQHAWLRLQVAQLPCIGWYLPALYIIYHKGMGLARHHIPISFFLRSLPWIILNCIWPHGHRSQKGSLTIVDIVRTVHLYNSLCMIIKTTNSVFTTCMNMLKYNVYIKQ